MKKLNKTLKPSYQSDLTRGREYRQRKIENSAGYNAHSRYKNGSVQVCTQLLQRNAGNYMLQSIDGQYEHSKKFIQAKLKIGQFNDPCEQEANRVAEKTTRMSGSQMHNELVQVKPTNAPNAFGKELEINPELESRINSLHGQGQPLAMSLRSFFEPRFHEDFSRVRIHSNQKADTIAKTLHARAFTIGHDIIFASGEYAPRTSSGKKLLAHELTHVVQQASLGKGEWVRRQGLEGAAQGAERGEVEERIEPYRNPEDAKEERLFGNNPEFVELIERKSKEFGSIYLTFDPNTPRFISALGLNNVLLINKNPLPLEPGTRIGERIFLMDIHTRNGILYKTKIKNAKYGEHFVIKRMSKLDLKRELVEHRLDLIQSHLEKIRERKK